MFQRRILYHGPDPSGSPTLLSDKAVAGCWFELHRQGGCGAAEIRLNEKFGEHAEIAIGDWISFEYSTGDRWYLGRVERWSAASPAGTSLHLEGMGIELNEVFPGGFASDADGVPPHRFGRTDIFSNDPDYVLETFDTASTATDLVTLLMERYVVPATHITHDPLLIEAPTEPAPIDSVKFRGEESVRAIIKQLATLARGASWGVDAAGKLFFQQRSDDVLATFRIGRDLTRVEAARDREFLFNRILLTGDYIYDVLDSSTFIARRSYRFRGNYVQPASRAAHGERRIRLWIPWIRTAGDALGFVREFFRTYSVPALRYAITTDSRTTLIRPWDGRIVLEDRAGAPLAALHVETVRVSFDHTPRFSMELGPDDPRTLWPEPPEDERWELPEQQPAGGIVSLTEQSSSFILTSAESSESDDDSSLASSLASSAGSSALTSQSGSGSSMISSEGDGESSSAAGSTIESGSSGLSSISNPSGSGGTSDPGTISIPPIGSSSESSSGGATSSMEQSL